MEHWKGIDHIIGVPMNQSSIQLEVTEDNHLTIYFFTDTTEKTVIIDFGEVFLYEIHEEMWLYSEKLYERSNVELGQGMLFEIFDSPQLNDIEHLSDGKYHHYFISTMFFYVECITTGIVNIEVK